MLVIYNQKLLVIFSQSIFSHNFFYLFHKHFVKSYICLFFEKKNKSFLKN